MKEMEIALKKQLLEQFNKEEVEIASNIFVKTEVELSYCEGIWPKGLMLLHILDKFGYKLTKRE
jgi:hypothetical protein